MSRPRGVESEDTMDVNALPPYDASDNPTGCCPRFDPRGWDDQELHFEDKLFVRVQTRSRLHVPIDMDVVFTRTLESILAAGAFSNDDFIILSRDMSPWASEHYFAVTKPVPGHEMSRLSGVYLTKVFEGPFRRIPKWKAAAKAFAKGRGRRAEGIYLFYTTCPRCAKVYGRNYVVALVKVYA